MISDIVLKKRIIKIARNHFLLAMVSHVLGYLVEGIRRGFLVDRKKVGCWSGTGVGEHAVGSGFQGGFTELDFVLKPSFG